MTSKRKMAGRAAPTRSQILCPLKAAGLLKLFSHFPCDSVLLVDSTRWIEGQYECYNPDCRRTRTIAIAVIELTTFRIRHPRWNDSQHSAVPVGFGRMRAFGLHCRDGFNGLNVAWIVIRSSNAHILLINMVRVIVNATCSYGSYNC